MKILYLDESGNCNLQKIDPLYPVFALGGVVVDSDDFHFNAELINNFKKKYFGTTDIVLHSSEIVRRKNNFHFLNNSGVWDEFLTDLNKVMDSMRYEVITCIINKNNIENTYVNVYEIALVKLLGVLPEIMPEQLHIIIESAGKVLDSEILMAYGKVTKNNNKQVQKISIQPKYKNIIGLQIADLVLPPLVRNYIKKTNNEDYEIVCKKCYDKGIIIIE